MASRYLPILVKDPSTLEYSHASRVLQWIQVLQLPPYAAFARGSVPMACFNSMHPPSGVTYKIPRLAGAKIALKSAHPNVNNACCKQWHPGAKVSDCEMEHLLLLRFMNHQRRPLRLSVSIYRTDYIYLASIIQALPQESTVRREIMLKLILCCVVFIYALAFML